MIKPIPITQDNKKTSNGITPIPIGKSVDTTTSGPPKITPLPVETP